ncbi:YugN family protein [Salimicrobium halophilum]|uniref:YugN-like family protein n=1 Tax=Salimicrobium halophilum TaxID=86666 RepID=A0A1G8VBE5_9BACI|nr:YugN family protein [Salimicrobium halophilum]SDJ63279.1 YugN-like family protein [Salimicrobium halophilum]
MEKLSSQLEGREFMFKEVKEALEKLGFVLASNWDTEHGYFDYVLETEPAIEVLRIPFAAEDFEGEESGGHVTITCPFLLKHQYEAGNDIDAKGGAIRGMFDQFQNPTDKDAAVDSGKIEQGKQVLEHAEVLLME